MDVVKLEKSLFKMILSRRSIFSETETSETFLYQIVSQLFTEKEILRHQRLIWLNGLELDIFIPALQLGVEYQGQQHFHPIEAWGGEKAIKALQERDARKVQICVERGVTLITIDYMEPLTAEYLRVIIDSRLKAGNCTTPR